MLSATIPSDHIEDVSLLADFLRLRHDIQPADIAIGLGSHDPTVPQVAVEFFHRDLVPRLVFTGANAPTTIDRFPRGEAVHYGEYAIEHGVPEVALLLEMRARSTAENFTLTRQLLAERGLTPRSAIVVSRPFQQRRAFAIAAKVWPELAVTCASTDLPLSAYVARIGDADLVISTMVGDAFRLTTDAAAGIGVPQDIPPGVTAAAERLAAAGYTSRLPATP